MNLNTSWLFPINQLALKIYYGSFPFKTEQQRLTYLGIQVTHAFIDLSKHNFQPLYKLTKKDLEKWASLPISLAGHINCENYSIAKVSIFIPNDFCLLANIFFQTIR